MEIALLWTGITLAGTANAWIISQIVSDRKERRRHRSMR